MAATVCTIRISQYLHNELHDELHQSVVDLVHTLHLHAFQYCSKIPGDLNSLQAVVFQGVVHSQELLGLSNPCPTPRGPPPLRQIRTRL